MQSLRRNEISIKSKTLDHSLEAVGGVYGLGRIRGRMNHKGCMLANYSCLGPQEGYDSDRCNGSGIINRNIYRTIFEEIVEENSVSNAPAGGLKQQVNAFSPLLGGNVDSVGKHSQGSCRKIFEIFEYFPRQRLDYIGKLHSRADSGPDVAHRSTIMKTTENPKTPPTPEQRKEIFEAARDARNQLRKMSREDRAELEAAARSSISGHSRATVGLQCRAPQVRAITKAE